MSDDIAIKVESLSKCYHIYDTPRDRLKQFVIPRLQRVIGMRPQQYFREFWALQDVSFEVKKGETVGIIGRNGSGKSTLLQMICGTLNPTSGSIQTNGRIAALLELGSGFNPEFTGRENVYLNGAVLGLSKEEIGRRFDEIAAFADIGEFIDQPVKTYSSGMFVRLAFSIQANVDPEILILDEALAVGDAYFVHRCMLRINELQRQGTTILFVSHDATAVRSLCSRVIWLLDGKIHGGGEASKIVDGYLAHLFNQKVVTESVEGAHSKQSAIDFEKATGLPLEKSIPNIDRRLGDQRCKIVGVGLYDELMHPLSSTKNEKLIILRITIVNDSVDSAAELTVGYSIRNSKGLDIASTNSKVEGLRISTVIGSHITIRQKITLPCLHPGSYAFTVSTGYIEQGDEITVADRIENALAFDVFSDKQVHVLMNFPTEICIEGDVQ